jgi:lipoprotein-anchoring transpeptidase ErfK/SrfK
LLYGAERLGYKKIQNLITEAFNVPSITVPKDKLLKWGRRLLCAVVMFLALVYGPVATLSRPTLPAVGDVFADRILIEKAARRLTLYRGNEIVATYPVSFGRGGLAPKRREGDGLTPEGIYTISGRNPRSAYFLSLRISYPDEADKERAAKEGVPPGSDIMIHGLRNGFGWLGIFHRTINWTQGCIALTNPEMRQLWRIVPDGTVVEIRT